MPTLATTCTSLLPGTLAEYPFVFISLLVVALLCVLYLCLSFLMAKDYDRGYAQGSSDTSSLYRLSRFKDMS